MMDGELNLIAGSNFTDQRGKITFFNTFNMEAIKRFYVIMHPNTSIVRGWRGHKIEQRWFRVIKGVFEISVVKIDDWSTPSKDLPQEVFILSAAEEQVLHIPAGFATCLRSLVENTEVLVFSDYLMDHAKNDDYLYPTDYFKKTKSYI